MSTLSTDARLKLQNYLIEHEGYRQYPYKDSRGVLTIGIGRNLFSRGISRPEAMFLCNNDINECEFFVSTNIDFYKDLDDVRKVVLLEICFQLGISGLLEFKKMLSALAKGDYKEAAKEMLDSDWEKQTPRRAYLLANMMEQGTWM